MRLIPFPAELIQTAWGWLQEFPKSNFDDYGPQNPEAWRKEILARGANQNELLFAVALDDGEPVGMIGVTWPGGRLAVMHGICFARKVHRTGVAREAMETLLNWLREAHVERIEAYYFVDNQPVHKFLSKLGFKQEGIMRAKTTRGGKPVDVRIAAIVEAAVQKGGDPAMTRSTAAEEVTH